MLGLIDKIFNNKGVQNRYEKKAGNPKVAELTNALQWSYYVKRYDYINSEYKVENCVVVHKDGCLQQCYGFRGNDLDCYSPAYVNTLNLYMNEAVKRLGDGWMVSIEAQRYMTSDYPESEFDMEAGYLVEQERKSSFKSHGEHFDSSYYLNLVFKPEVDLSRKTKKIFLTEVSYEKAQDDLIDEFMKETKRLCGLLANRMYIRPLSCKETIEYLHSTVSLYRHQMIAPDHMMFLDTYISDSTLYIGQTLKLDDMFIPILCINDFPMETYPSILHELNKCYIEYRWVSRFFPLEKPEAQKELEKWQGKHHGARKSAGQMMAEMAMDVTTAKENVGAGELESDVGEAMKELQMDIVGLGYYNTCVMVWDYDFDKAMAKLQTVRTLIEAVGFTCKEETFNAYNAFLGMTAGDVYRNIRRPLVNSGNYAHVLPLSAVWSGILFNKFSNEVCGVDKPLVTCSTNYGTPFYLNLNDGDVGHTLIFGPTGAGKSTLLGLLSVSYLKYPNAEVFIIDKGMSALTMTLAVGGEYIDPAGIDKCFQPLGDIDNPADKQWACEFITVLCEMQGVPVTAAISVAINATIEQMSVLERKRRTLTTFRQSCIYKDPNTGQNPIDDAIQPYTLSGPYGRIFDGEKNNINNSRWLLFEMSELMEFKEKVVAPAIMIIFRLLEKKFKGQMTLLIIDEAWRFLDHEVFKARMRQWLKELRKKHVFCVFATQEVADGANSDIASTLIQNCPTKIYLADPEAYNNAWAYRKFGLTDDEINILATARKKNDYYYKSPIGTRLFQLSLGPITLGLMRQMDNIIRDKKGQEVRWGDFCDFLLHKREEDNTRRGYVEEILDMQRIPYRQYLQDVQIQEQM